MVLGKILCIPVSIFLCASYVCTSHCAYDTCIIKLTGSLENCLHRKNNNYKSALDYRWKDEGKKSKETAVKILLRLSYCKTTVTSFVWCGFRPLLPSTGILTTKAKLKLCCNSLKDSAVCRGEANFQIQMHQRSLYLELKTDKHLYMNQLPCYLGF